MEYRHSKSVKHIRVACDYSGRFIPAAHAPGPAFIARRLRKWLNRLTVKPLFIERGIPRENGFVESFTGKMRDKFLNGEIFYSLKEVEVLLELWRIECNTMGQHSSPGYNPPALKTVIEQNPISQPLGRTR